MASRRAWLVAAALVAGAASGAVAQADSALYVPGQRYRAGPLHELLFGRNWRQIWATPVPAPRLDLARFGGGLEPIRTGGNQSTTLHLRGADGRRYIFRSVDKSIDDILPQDVRHTPVGNLIQDQTSALFPAAELAVGPLQDAAGLLYPPARLAVMPDDARLGEFRDDFAGMLGIIFERPNEGEDGQPGFAGSPRIVEMATMLERLDESPMHRVDSREFLAARLIDFLIGDIDRSDDQWRWARYGEEGAYVWRPIALDRDHAFMNSGGLLIMLVRRVYPKLVGFEPGYPELGVLVFTAPEIDRRLLSDLDRPAWDSVTAMLKTRITDAVIDQAVAELAEEHRARAGARLARTLRARRDRLHEISADFYRYLAAVVDVHGTAAADHAEIERRPDGSVEVRLYDDATAGAEAPYFRRRFLPDETREVRIHLHGGRDRAVVRGAAAGRVRVRVIGGPADDVLVDAVSGDGAAGVTILYEDGDGGPATPILDSFVDDEWFDHKTGRDRFRDWGGDLSWRPRVFHETGSGLVVGGGPMYTRYDFRRRPYGFRIDGSALVAGFDEFGIEVGGDHRRENSPFGASLQARAVQFAAFRFFGLGNRSGAVDPAAARVGQDEISAAALLDWRPRSSTRVSVGPAVVYRRPRPGSGALIRSGLPGQTAVGQAGARWAASLDGRDDPAVPARGYTLHAGASVWPWNWGIPDRFGDAHLLGTAYLPLRGDGGTVLALRAGGRRVWGGFPIQEAAFVGGRGTLRGFDAWRFAGDASLFTSAELRVPLARITLLSRGTLGAIALADAGRVFVDGRSLGGWHRGIGGGLWFATLGRAVSLAFARGDGSHLYAWLGMPY